MDIENQNLFYSWVKAVKQRNGPRVCEMLTKKKKKNNGKLQSEKHNKPSKNINATAEL